VIEIHPRLLADTISLVQLTLCEVRLMRDSENPWLVLIPNRADVSEWHELSAPSRQQLSDEIAHCSEVLSSLFKPKKINVGMLGNIVPQFHVHVIARFERDRAWPGPIWGTKAAKEYTEDSALIKKLRESLGF
jgi:diadenosine tetraphosphate (Ap4A) HIT family hydrolase